MAVGETQREGEEANTPFAQFHARYPRVPGGLLGIAIHPRRGPAQPAARGEAEGTERRREPEKQAERAGRGSGQGEAGAGAARSRPSKVAKGGLWRPRCPRVARAALTPPG